MLATYLIGSWYAALLSGMFNITVEPTVLEVIAWVAYGVPVLVLFLWRPRRKPARSAAGDQPVATESTAHTDRPVPAPTPQQ
jgi:high-affinity iron transporter